MPIQNGSYVSPTWVDDAPPAMDAAEMQAITDTVAANQSQSATASEQALAAFATDTASGSIATIPDGADNIPVKSLTAQITPVQDLNGYDSPWPAGGGKNKLPNTLEDGVSSGVTFKTNADGTISATGTTQASSVYRPLCSRFALPPSTSYILNGNSGNAQIRIREYDSGGNLLATTTTSGSAESTFTVNASTDHCDAYLIAFGSIGSTVNLTYKPMLRLSTVSDATFAPYENVCPITGWTGAEIYRTDFNLWNEQWESGSINNTTGQNETGTTIRSKDYIPIWGNTPLYLFCGTNVSYFWLHFYDSSKVWITAYGSEATSATNAVFTPPANAAYMRFRTIATYGTTYNNDVAILYPSTITTYSPGTDNTTYTVTWQDEAGTVYGGTAEYIGGGQWQVTPTMAIVDMGSLNYSQGFNGYYTTALASSINIPSSVGDSGLLSDIFKVGNTAGANQMYIQINSSYLGWIVFLPSAVYSTAADFKAAMSGHQLVYELATPGTPFVVSGPDPATLYGDNNVWADCGPLTLNYRADTGLYIAKKIAEVTA